MSDLIERQAAIDIVNKYNKSHMVLKGKPMLGAAPIVIELEDLPAAQPEERTEERTETHACDCISRQKAINTVGRMFLVCGDNNSLVDYRDLMVEALKVLPAAQPERKTGRWIKDEKTDAGQGLSNYLCDQCGECGGTWLSDLKPHQFPKFCMWCGAKMEVEHETDNRKE